MLLPLLAGNSTSATTPLSGLLTGYWQGLVGFILGIASLVVADLFLTWYRRRRDRPQIWVEPKLAPADQNLFVSLNLRNSGRTPLVGAVNRVVVATPHLAVQGKRARFLPQGGDIKPMPWSVLGEEKLGPEDLFPIPDLLPIELGFFTKAGHAFSISILDTEPDLFGFAGDLAFSESATEAKETVDLKVAFLVWIRGMTPYGVPIQKRFTYLLTIPAFGGLSSCDFKKATMIPFETKHEWGDLRPLIRSQGLEYFNASDLMPPFDPPKDA